MGQFGIGLNNHPAESVLGARSQMLLEQWENDRVVKDPVLWPANACAN